MYSTDFHRIHDDITSKNWNFQLLVEYKMTVSNRSLQCRIKLTLIPKRFTQSTIVECYQVITREAKAKMKNRFIFIMITSGTFQELIQRHIIILDQAQLISPRMFFVQRTHFYLNIVTQEVCRWPSFVQFVFVVNWSMLCACDEAHEPQM